MPKPLKPKRISSTQKSIRQRTSRVNKGVVKGDIAHLKKLVSMLGIDDQNRDFSQPFSVEVTLTPSQMSNILKYHNEGNRKIDRRQVDSLTRSFQTTGYIDIDPFLVGKDGNFFNGQHRMMAAIKANKQLTVTLKIGLPPETRLIVDNGRKKRPNDALDFLGVHNGEHILSIYKGALDGHNLDFKYKADWDVACCPHKHRNTNFPADEILDIYHKYKDAFDFVSDLFHNGDKSLWNSNSSIKGAFFRAYLANPLVYGPVLQEIVRYKRYPSNDDDINKVRVLSAFDGKIDKAGAKSKDSQTFCYALTESLIQIFSKPIKQLKNIRICPVQDEAFPRPDLDYRDTSKPFKSGPDKRREARGRMSDIDEYNVA